MSADIRSQTADELRVQLEAWGYPAYRLSQVLGWLYLHCVKDWNQMSNLPKNLRDQLQTNYTLRSLELVRKQGARDTTQKFLWRLSDRSLIETVLIPASPALYGDSSDRHTLCISTQVGCAYGCKFCASGLEGWRRDLQIEEIVDQILAVERWHSSNAGVSAPRDPKRDGAQPGVGRSSATISRLVNNVVVMGMGEPLANYENLLKALQILNAKWGRGIGARKITISTSGLVPQIRRLADEPYQFRLAISLHGATDETRNKIMPVNRKYPIRELMAACDYYAQKKGRMITFEYILIAGVNDSLKEAKPLAELARRFDAKVNLIPYNRVESLSWERPTEEHQEAFLKTLEHHDVAATLRREKGHDIDAACGQLRLKTEQETADPRE